MNDHCNQYKVRFVCVDGCLLLVHSRICVCIMGFVCVTRQRYACRVWIVVGAERNVCVIKRRNTGNEICIMLSSLFFCSFMISKVQAAISGVGNGGVTHATNLFPHNGNIVRVKFRLLFQSTKHSIRVMNLVSSQSQAPQFCKHTEKST